MLGLSGKQCSAMLSARRSLTALVTPKTRFIASSKSTVLSQSQLHATRFTPSQRQVRWISTSPIFMDVIEVKTPSFPESISEGDVRWIKAVSETVSEDEPVAEIETDKTAIPVPSPSAGVVVELLVPDGERVTPGVPLFKLDNSAQTGEAPATPPTEATAPQPAAQAESSSASPPAEPKLANDGPIPTERPPIPELPTKPIATHAAGAMTPPPAALPQQQTAAGGGNRSEHRVKLTRMRLRIADRLKSAQNTAAMLTTFNDIDMSNIVDLRRKFKDDFQKQHDVKLSFMSAFIKASAYALQEMPVVNAVLDDHSSEIVYRDYVDISVAVATPKGLVVPVMRNVESMNYADIEKALGALGEKARNNQLAIEDMDGGTFTISNGGVFGSLMGTPIINPPQSAILGMHGIFDRPVAVDGAVVIRPMMYVALTYDHRLIDGREGVTFLRKIKAAVEDPRVVLLGL